MEDNKKEVKIGPSGSLGVLALGHVGLDLWRAAKEEAKKARAAEENKTEEKKGEGDERKEE